MEPAMALCFGVAAVTLTFGALISLPALGRRLEAVRIPIPIRPLAVLLMMVSTTAILTRPRPAVATVSPPIVRLVDETAPPTESGDAAAAGAEDTSSTAPPERSGGTVRARTERSQPSAAAYVVEPGDSLWRIAASVLRSGGESEPSSAEVARFWPVIYAENRTLIGDNPNLIFPGQQLLIPEG